MDILSEIGLLEYLNTHPIYSRVYNNYQPLPVHYCKNINNVKAILLGADPSAYEREKVNKKRKLKRFKTVFDLDNPKMPLYFRKIDSDLKLVGLTKEQLYIQNTCKNYFNIETTQNKYWIEIARLWIPLLKKELEMFSYDIPVLISADKILFALMGKNRSKSLNAKKLYNEQTIIGPSENALNRRLIPFFRSPAYNLSDHEAFSDFVKNTFTNN